MPFAMSCALPLPRAVKPSCLNHIRTFTSTARTLYKSHDKRLAHEHKDVPTYPYGPSLIYKQSNFGLYGPQKIRYGNIVSKKNEIKTRRFWRPNVRTKRMIYGRAKMGPNGSVGIKIKTRITARVMRTLEKVGGLDRYLLKEKPQRIKDLGMGGWKLRWALLKKTFIQKRFNDRRKALGLPLQTPINELLLAAKHERRFKEQAEERAAIASGQVTTMTARQTAARLVADLKKEERAPILEAQKAQEKENARLKLIRWKEKMKEGKKNVKRRHRSKAAQKTEVNTEG